MAAIGAFEHEVEVWSVQTGCLLSTFATILDFGGRRLAITSDGTRVIAGAYHRHGVACYDATDGRMIWQRKDLKRVQRICIASNDRDVCCGFDDRPAHVLEIHDGETRDTVRGVRDVCVSPFDELTFLDKSKAFGAELSSLHRTVGRITRVTFAFLDAAFSPDNLITTESTGPIRCFSCKNASELWRHDLPNGSHALRVTYNAELKVFQAVVWPYLHSRDREIISLARTTGSRASIVTYRGTSDEQFCLRGTHLLTCAGSLFRCSDGQVVREFSFFAHSGQKKLPKS